MKRLNFRASLGLVLSIVASISALSGCSNLPQATKSSTSLASFLGLAELPDWYLTSKYSYSDSKWLSNDFNTKIHYRDVGEGPVILLLHGELSSLHVWEEWINILSNDFRLIAIDLPGSGLTSAPHCITDEEKTCADNLSSDYIAHTLEYFIEDLGIHKFSLVGSSYSGYLAAQYAATQHPEKLDKLILISPKGYQQDIPNALDFATSSGFDVLNRYVQPSWLITDIVKKFHGVNPPTDEITQRYLHLAQSKGARISNVTQLKLVRELMDHGMLLDLDDIEAPTLIMWGGNDNWGDFTHAERWSNEINDSTLVTYPNYGHALMEEGREITAADAAAFINDEPIPTLNDGVGGDALSIEDQLNQFDEASLFGNGAQEMEDAE